MKKMVVGSLFILLNATNIQAITVSSDSLINTNPFSSSVISAASSRKQNEWDTNINNDNKLATIDRRVADITGEAQAINGGTASGVSLAQQIADLTLEIDKSNLASASAMALAQQAASEQAALAEANRLAQEQAAAAAAAAQKQNEINICNGRANFRSTTYQGRWTTVWDNDYYWNGSTCAIRRYQISRND